VITFILILNLLVIICSIFLIFFFRKSIKVDGISKDQIFKQTLEKAADQVLNQQSASIREVNLEEIKKTLNPFKEQLQRDLDLLKAQISQQNVASAKSEAKFEHQIDSLLNATSGMQEDAQNLTKALKGDNKLQGDWGEQVLKKALEKSGLQEGVNYELQKSFKTNDGKIQRPDAVIYLPNKRNIIIDSKVSLTAWERYVNSDDEEKSIFLKDHIDSLKKHIKELSNKNYNDLEDLCAPDYLFVFVPIESALSAALSSDWDLQTIANNKNIAFLTPTILIAVLRIAENFWRLDMQNKNAEDIAERAGLLYQKFSGLSDDLSKVGDYISKAHGAYNSAQRKLSEGDGNLFSQVEKLKHLGAKTKTALLKQPSPIKKEE